MKSIRKMLAGAVFIILIAVSTSSFGSLIYNVDRSIGAGTVTGIISTDGTLGSLTADNIVDWQLVISDGQGSVTLDGPDSESGNSNLILSSSFLTATLEGIHFNIGTDGIAYWRKWDFSTSTNWWCLEGISRQCGITPPGGESLRLIGNIQQSSHNGQVVIATLTSVPVPAAFWLFGTGLVGLVGVASRIVAHNQTFLKDFNS